MSDQEMIVNLIRDSVKEIRSDLAEIRVDFKAHVDDDKKEWKKAAASRTEINTLWRMGHALWIVVTTVAGAIWYWFKG